MYAGWEYQEPVPAEGWAPWPDQHMLLPQPHAIPQLAGNPYRHVIDNLSRQISGISTDMTQGLNQLRRNVQETARRADTMRDRVERLEYLTNERYVDHIDNTMKFNYPRASLFNDDWYARFYKRPP